MNGNAMGSFMDFGRSPEWGRCNRAVLCMGQAYSEWGRLGLCNLRNPWGMCLMCFQSRVFWVTWVRSILKTHGAWVSWVSESRVFWGTWVSGTLVFGARGFSEK